MFRSHLRKLGVTLSYSHPGMPLDNAVAESFFACMKREELSHNYYDCLEDYGTMFPIILTFSIICVRTNGLKCKLQQELKLNLWLRKTKGYFGIPMKFVPNTPSVSISPSIQIHFFTVVNILSNNKLSFDIIFLIIIFVC